MSESAQTIPGMAAPAPAAQNLAQGKTANVPADTSAPVSAVDSVPGYGGNRAGKARQDGLVPGSAEAIAADREKEAARKRAERAKKRAEQVPPTLPPAGAGPVQAASPDPGGGDGNSGNESFVPWAGETLRPLVDELIEVAEEGRALKIVGLARNANLPPKVLTQIEKDAQFSKSSKTMLSQSAPRVAAKWMNKSGISAEYEPETVMMTAMLSIIIQTKRQTNALQKLIAEHRAELLRQNNELRKKDAAKGMPA